MWKSLFGRDDPDEATTEPSQPAPPSQPFAERMLEHANRVGWTARQAGAHLPVGALPQLGQIEDILYPLLTHLRASAPTVDEEIAVESFVGDYLPTTIHAFLTLNRQFAHQPGADGRSPATDLVDQLETLEDAIRDLAQAVYAHDAQQLSVQGRFLSDKFSRSDLEL